MTNKTGLSQDAFDLLCKLVAHYEGLHDGDLRAIGLQPKMCPAGYWTEGYGQVITDSKGKMIRGIENKALAYKYSKIKTVEQALEALGIALYARAVFVNKLGLPINDYQKASLISIGYNIGLGNLKTSGLVRAIKNKASNTVIDANFREWNKARVRGELVVLEGLDKRRVSEAYLYILSKLNFK